MKVDPAKDAVSPAVKGKKSKLDASEELPEAPDAAALPEAVAALKGALPQALGILLESGLPLKGSAGLRRVAERLQAAGVGGVQTTADGTRSVAVGLSGEALARLKVKIQGQDGATVYKPADLGLVGIRFGA